ncbi:MAG TPA: ParB/RepB/Spo0J family partition protein [Actinophytocola sp.]|nr:ParB/RepB/Spo0J family partition protein [Actinophytocola sp.]
MPVDRLLPADSPRLAGQDTTHVGLLAQIAIGLPPILVHRETMRVIDGMHRLEAAILRGARDIEVQYFEGSEHDAFLLAVRANTTHGLPLSLADREAAAIRIATVHPEWADRVIAEIVGLAATTIGALRRRHPQQLALSTIRVGKDGKVRPLNGAEGRRRASEVIAERPDASLREVARAAGISVGTARDVRERMRRGQSPIPDSVAPRQADGQAPRPQPTEGPADPRNRQLAPADRLSALRTLQRDPSLRFTEAGRSLLRRLDLHTLSPDACESFLDAIPPHCAHVVADLAGACGEAWLQFAAKVKDRVRTGNVQPVSSNG